MPVAVMLDSIDLTLLWKEAWYTVGDTFDQVVLLADGKLAVNEDCTTVGTWLAESVWSELGDTLVCEQELIIVAIATANKNFTFFIICFVKNGLVIID